MSITSFKSALTPLASALKSRRFRVGLSSLLAPGVLMAGPTGGALVDGAAVIRSPDALTTVVDQSSHSAIIQWQEFSVGNQEYVLFNQPTSSSVVLNRVVGGSASAILGQIQANGRVFIVNPQGVMFGEGARVDVGGLVASTLDIADDDFIAGRYVLRNPGAGQVLNQGNLIAGEQGFVVLAGADGVINDGNIVAGRLGDVVLASGNQMTLDLAGDGLVNFAVDQATVSAQAGVSNLGEIATQGGTVVMTARTAQQLMGAAVNNAGRVSAQGLAEEGGEIILTASGPSGDVINSGTLDVSSRDQNGGNLLITADGDVTLTSSSDLQLTGRNGGVAHVIAKDHLEVAAGSMMDGRASAQDGKGGFVEVSGHGSMVLDSFPLLGRGGTLLIDPDNICITSGQNSCSGGANFTNVNKFDIEGSLQFGTDVFLIANNSITVANLNGFDITANTPESANATLLLGVGSPAGMFGDSTYGFTPAIPQFSRGTGNGVGAVIFEGAANGDGVNIFGDFVVVGGSGAGDVTIGNIVAGTTQITAKGNITVGSVDTSSTNDQETVLRSESGSVLVKGNLLTLAEAGLNRTVIQAANGITIKGKVDVQGGNGEESSDSAAIIEDAVNLELMAGTGVLDVYGSVSVVGAANTLTATDGGETTFSEDITRGDVQVSLSGNTVQIQNQDARNVIGAGSGASLSAFGVGRVGVDITAAGNVFIAQSAAELAGEEIGESILLNADLDSVLSERTNDRAIDSQSALAHLNVQSGGQIQIGGAVVAQAAASEIFLRGQRLDLRSIVQDAPLGVTNQYSEIDENESPIFSTNFSVHHAYLEARGAATAANPETVLIRGESFDGRRIGILSSGGNAGVDIVSSGPVKIGGNVELTSNGYFVEQAEGSNSSQDSSLFRRALANSENRYRAPILTREPSLVGEVYGGVAQLSIQGYAGTNSNSGNNGAFAGAVSFDGASTIDIQGVSEQSLRIRADSLDMSSGDGFAGINLHQRTDAQNGVYGSFASTDGTHVISGAYGSRERARMNESRFELQLNQNALANDADLGEVKVHGIQANIDITGGDRVTLHNGAEVVSTSPFDYVETLNGDVLLDINGSINGLFVGNGPGEAIDSRSPRLFESSGDLSVSGYGFNGLFISAAGIGSGPAITTQGITVTHQAGHFFSNQSAQSVEYNGGALLSLRSGAGGAQVTGDVTITGYGDAASAGDTMLGLSNVQIQGDLSVDSVGGIVDAAPGFLDDFAVPLTNDSGSPLITASGTPILLPANSVSATNIHLDFGAISSTDFYDRSRLNGSTLTASGQLFISGDRGGSQSTSQESVLQVDDSLWTAADLALSDATFYGTNLTLRSGSGTSDVVGISLQNLAIELSGTLSAHTNRGDLSTGTAAGLTSVRAQTLDFKAVDAGVKLLSTRFEYVVGSIVSQAVNAPDSVAVEIINSQLLGRTNHRLISDGFVTLDGAAVSSAPSESGGPTIFGNFLLESKGDFNLQNSAGIAASAIDIKTLDGGNVLLNGVVSTPNVLRVRSSGTVAGTGLLNAGAVAVEGTAIDLGGNIFVGSRASGVGVDPELIRLMALGAPSELPNSLAPNASFVATNLDGTGVNLGLVRMTGDYLYVNAPSVSIDNLNYNGTLFFNYVSPLAVQDIADSFDLESISNTLPQSQADKGTGVTIVEPKESEISSGGLTVALGSGTYTGDILFPASPTDIGDANLVYLTFGDVLNSESIVTTARVVDLHPFRVDRPSEEVAVNAQITSNLNDSAEATEEDAEDEQADRVDGTESGTQESIVESKSTKEEDDGELTCS